MQDIFWFMPVSQPSNGLPLFLKGRELFNNLSVFRQQTASRLLMAKLPEARHTWEQMKGFVCSPSMLYSFPLRISEHITGNFLTHTVTGVKRFLKTYKAHIQKESPPEKSCEVQNWIGTLQHACYFYKDQRKFKDLKFLQNDRSVMANALSSCLPNTADQ